MNKHHALTFHADAKFRIAQLTDLHITNGDETDRKTIGLVERALDVESPDLVVLTGDVIEGKRCRNPIDSWLAAVQPMETRSIPWAAVFGNHDDEGAINRSELMQLQQSLPFCLSEPGPEDVPGVGNYGLTIQDADTNCIGATLHLLDSNSYATDGRVGYGWLEKRQIEWYRERAQQFTDIVKCSKDGAKPIPALAFFHIPLPEYDHVWRLHAGIGSKNEPVCCPPINTGMFDAMCEMGDVMGVFVGHDHINDYEAELNGIRLCYGRATGYGGYGMPGFRRGVRIIEIQSGVRDFSTWLRLDDRSDF